MTRPPGVLGWDIGGVNTKAARFGSGTNGPALASSCMPCELKVDSRGLRMILTEVARNVGATATDVHAVTMTAELSQAFRTKREGVAFVLDALHEAFPETELHVYTTNGRFVGPEEARKLPLAVAAANWTATANLVAGIVPTCVLIDIGTTSTDLIPILDGRVMAQGRTDPERLISGELVYTGALRTPAEAIARRVPLWGKISGVSADGFALIGDAHLWLGRLQPEDYACPTPDNRPSTRETAAERLARVVCGDREMLDDGDIDGIAAALASAQVRTVAEALERVLERSPEITSAVVAGLGDFIAIDAALSAGLEIIRLADWLGSASRTAPAAAVASLLRTSLGHG